MEVVVLGDPVVNITGPTNVCEGDTNTYQVNFTPNTYYSWSTNATTDVIAYQDTSNNVMNIAFDNPGNYTLTIDVLNQCGEGTDNQIVHVLAFPNADAQPDTLLCIGQSTQIFTPPGAGYTYSWSDGNANVGNAASINVTPPATTDYILTVTGTGGCQAHDTVTVEIQMPDPPVVYQDSICDGNIIPITLEADSVGTYLWYEGSTTSSIEVDAVGTYDLSIDVPGMLCPHLVQYNVYLAQPDPPYIYIDSICPNGNLTLAADSVGTYEWQNGSTSSFISVHDPGTYEVSIIIPDAFCPRLVEYHVNELTPDQPILRYDSVCPNGPDNIVLSADTTGTYWSNFRVNPGK